MWNGGSGRMVVSTVRCALRLIATVTAAWAVTGGAAAGQSPATDLRVVPESAAPADAPAAGVGIERRSELLAEQIESRKRAGAAHRPRDYQVPLLPPDAEAMPRPDADDGEITGAASEEVR